MRDIFGIKASKPTKDIETTDIRELNIDSSKNLLKVYLSSFGTASVTTGVDWTLTVTHSLGYKPISWFYFKHPDNSRWHLAPCKADINSGATWTLLGNVENTDANNVLFRIYDSPVFDPPPSSPFNVDYKYFILVDPRFDAWYE